MKIVIPCAVAKRGGGGEAGFSALAPKPNKTVAAPASTTPIQLL